MKNYVPTLAREALAALSKRWEFTPKGPILIEMFPRHDDFAVRTLGLPGMIGALGACFGRVVTLDSPTARAAGRVQLGRDAVARAGARDHAAAVGPARAAVADRRHLGVRGEARASRVGPRDGHPVRPRDRSRAGAEAARPQLAASATPQTISLAYYQASLRRRAHRRAPTASRSCARWSQSYADGIDTEAAIKTGARRRHRRAAEDLRRVPREALRRAAQGAGGARGPEGGHAGSTG